MNWKKVFDFLFFIATLTALYSAGAGWAALLMLPYVLWTYLDGVLTGVHATMTAVRRTLAGVAK